MTHRLIAITVASVVALMSTALHAETIKLSEFDLTTAQGNEALYKRIVSSARQQCSPALRGVATDMRAYRHCVDETVDSTVKQTRLPSLHAFHAAKTADANRIAANDP